ncbi:hypothetical protein ACFFX0_17780 [Citricoccus parietis]|uniref:Uncharacterized protein n=1 Tax=Citricoccus parietis TaxID=592307 RepID=A0ABV5G1Y9_9MICC
MVAPSSAGSSRAAAPPRAPRATESDLCRPAAAGSPRDRPRIPTASAASSNQSASNPVPSSSRAPLSITLMTRRATMRMLRTARSDISTVWAVSSSSGRARRLVGEKVASSRAFLTSLRRFSTAVCVPRQATRPIHAVRDSWERSASEQSRRARVRVP